jgi:hypothetical protein
MFIYRIKRNQGPVKALSRIAQLNELLPMLSYQEFVAVTQRSEQVEFIHKYSDPFITQLRGNGFQVSTHWIDVNPDHIVSLSIEKTPDVFNLPDESVFWVVVNALNPLLDRKRIEHLRVHGGSCLVTNFEAAHRLYRALLSMHYYPSISTAKVSV